jgi:hypothetical protein
MVKFGYETQQENGFESVIFKVAEKVNQSFSEIRFRRTLSVASKIVFSLCF